MENTNYALSARNTRNSYVKMAVAALSLGLPFLVPAVALCATDWKILGTVLLSGAGAFFAGLAVVHFNKAYWWHKDGARRLEVIEAERAALAQKDEEIARLQKELKEERRKHQWVPIHNRMPGLDEEVLASDGNSVYLDSFLENENGQYRMDNHRTLYWMELPGLPK